MIRCEPMNSRPLCSLISSLLSITLCLMSSKMPLHQESCAYPLQIFWKSAGLFSMLKMAAIVMGLDGASSGESGSHDNASAMVLSLPFMYVIKCSY